MIKTGQVDTYHIGEGKQVIIMFEDIFGMASGRHKSVADAYASLGYNVYVPKLIAHPYEGDIDIPKIMASAKSQNFKEMTDRFHQLVKHLEELGHK